MKSRLFTLGVLPALVYAAAYCSGGSAHAHARPQVAVVAGSPVLLAEAAPAVPQIVSQLAADPNAPINLGAVTQVASYLSGAYHDGNTAMLAGVLCILMTWLLMRVVGLKRIPALSTPLGGAGIAAAVSVFGACGTTFLAHGAGPLSWHLVGVGLVIGLGSSAVYTFVKQAMKVHAPAWLHDLVFGLSAPAAAK